MSESNAHRQRTRVLRFLAQGDATPLDAASPGAVLLDDGSRGAISVDRHLLAQMVKERLLRAAAGRIRLVSSAQDERRREIGSSSIQTPTGPEAVAVNWSESPLCQLARRKGRDGKPFLNQAEFLAGEQLRTDYTRGQIMPRLGANWVSSVASGRRAGGIADITDAALAARIRVDQAIEAVGPELSGLLIDVCCFLKGMEAVEMERGWPARSAKVVLKTGLGILSRHYNPARVHRERKVLHWGAADYRPVIRSP